MLVIQFIRDTDGKVEIFEYPLWKYSYAQAEAKAWASMKRIYGDAAREFRHQISHQ